MPYWVVLPHPNQPMSVQPKIRKYKPDIDNMECWRGYDYVQGPFKTKSAAEEHVKAENEFRKSRGVK